MSCFFFHCPFCSQKMEVQDEWVGMQVNCPSCNQVITVKNGNNTVKQTGNKVESINKKSIEHNHGDKDTERDKKSHNKTIGISLLALLALLNIQAGIFLYLHVESFLGIGIKISSIEGEISRIRQAISTVSSNINDVNTNINDVKMKLTNPVVAYKLIDYTWEYPSLMKSGFESALKEGYEPAGLVSLNSLKGGIFLFIKRSKELIK